MYFQRGLLKGKVALITGGGTGIGLQIARGLGGVGATVVIASRTESRLADAVERLRAEAIEAHFKILDTRDDTQVEQVVSEVVAEFGAIDVLVNNAGGQFPVKAENLTPKGWRAVIDVCLNGTFYVTRAVGAHMIARGRGGKIVNVSASCIDRGSPGIVHSGAARAAVSHMTRTLAMEWAQFNIQVNAIGPQYLSEGARANLNPAVAEFIPSVTPAGRWATDEEIQSWGVILASPMSHYVTGVTIYLDGGNWLGEGIVYRGSPVCPE
jgi:NAD(P)-dependent dehydrogenase (short-subunit alcohol dehydrogenase family)